jgi:hypothetical protein
MQAGLHLRAGFMRDRTRKLVQLFDYPQGWQEGTQAVMRRCVRNGKPSNVYDTKYADSDALAVGSR